MQKTPTVKSIRNLDDSERESGTPVPRVLTSASTTYDPPENRIRDRALPMRESSREATTEGRRLNVWLEQRTLPLVVDLTVEIRVDIGPPREDALGGGPAPEIDWRGVEYVDLIIAVCGENLSVSPASHRVRLPRVGKSNEVVFRVTPRRAGTVVLHVDVLRPGDFALLEEYQVSLEVTEAEVAQTV
jgi:hypothetical protein